MGTIYIAGPMTGIEGHNFPAFNRAAERWRATGWQVENPAENFGGREDLPRAVYMREDFLRLLRSDAVAMLQGWRESKGATLEYAIARELAIPVYDAETAAEITEGGDVLADAGAAVRLARRADYGPPKENHERTAAMWTAYLGVAVTARHVCMMNVLQKASRDAHRAKHDNLVDIAGYAANAGECR